MKKRDYRDYLQDIAEAVNDIEAFTRGLTCAAFAGDRKTINAVVRSVEIIGEAAKKLPPSLKNRHAAIPWKKMAGMRDKLIHEYFGIDLDILWQTVKKDIPALKSAIGRLAAEIAAEGGSGGK